MDAGSCLFTFNRPADYDAVFTYTDAKRGFFGKIRNARSNLDIAKKTLELLLENCRFENCRPNKGYHEALGVPPN